LKHRGLDGIFISLFIHPGYEALNDWMMANYRNLKECERGDRDGIYGRLATRAFSWRE